MRKVRITESQLKGLVRKMIKEEMETEPWGEYTERWLQQYFLTRGNFWGQNGRHEPGKLVWGTVGGGGAVPASPDFESKTEALQYAFEKGWHKKGQISKSQVDEVN